MEEEEEKSLSPKNRAKRELEDAFIAALDKIKESNHVEEQISDLQVDNEVIDTRSDLEEEEAKEVDVDSIKEKTEEELTEAERVEIYKKLTQLRGIGNKTAEKLVEFGITSIEDIAELEVDMIPETLGIATKSLRTAIKNARKHLEREIKEEKSVKIEEITLDSQEDISVEAMELLTQEEDLEEAPISKLTNEGLTEIVERTLKDKASTEAPESDWKAEIDQFVKSARDDIKFFYDQMAKFHDAITEMRSAFHALEIEMNQIDERLNEVLIKKVKSDIDIAKTKIDELKKEEISKTMPTETMEAINSSEESVNIVDLVDLKDAKVKSKSIKKMKKVRVIIPFDELIHRLNDVGLIRGTNDPYFTICEILAENKEQEMNYDTLFIKSQLPPQTFSEIIFDLSTKKILDFDAKTDTVSIRTFKK
ncbi:helix-hairpin-helix domain-containing protein [Candidatus Borrarchaeum sp.]|uniref:helix-hairpin-helix domain-containing protein n=1 Tax=Candidatus Borrarchaeum sp. TaxID=2846742 RepID=UPI00257AB495|nr:helix-hairpin-helix domain-containing protein [Candidatus Borrarchaeum sp.]